MHISCLVVDAYLAMRLTVEEVVSPNICILAALAAEGPPGDGYSQFAAACDASQIQGEARTAVSPQCPKD